MAMASQPRSSAKFGSESLMKLLLLGVGCLGLGSNGGAFLWPLFEVAGVGIALVAVGVDGIEQAAAGLPGLVRRRPEVEMAEVLAEIVAFPRPAGVEQGGGRLVQGGVIFRRLGVEELGGSIVAVAVMSVAAVSRGFAFLVRVGGIFGRGLVRLVRILGRAGVV